MTADELNAHAANLAVSVQTIRRLFLAGEIAAVKVDGQYRIVRAERERFKKFSKFSTVPQDIWNRERRNGRAKP